MLPKARPSHVLKTPKGLHVCTHCGADVDEEGLYAGSTPADGLEEWEKPQPKKSPTSPEREERGLHVFTLALRDGSRSRSTHEESENGASRPPAQSVLR